MALMSLSLQCSVPIRLPSPISVTHSPSMLIMRCITYLLLSTHASTTSPTDVCPGECRMTLSLPPMINGSILLPFTGNVTLTPSLTSLIASSIISRSVTIFTFSHCCSTTLLQLDLADNPSATWEQSTPAHFPSDAGHWQSVHPSAYH